MKILLINPSQNKVYGRRMLPAYPPLGLLYIGAELKKEGHQIRMLDIDIEGINEDKYAEIFRDFNPDSIGITSTTPTISDAFKWGKISKKLNKEIPVILGGIHATVAPEETIRQDAFDIIVIGEAEITAKEVFGELSNPMPKLEKIKGICFKINNKITKNDMRPLIDDLDSIDFPDRTLLKRPKAYLPPDALHFPVASIITSRGCPGACTFCCTKNIFSKLFRQRSVANTIEEIEYLVNKDGIREIHIVDDVFSFNKKRTLEFCEEIKRKNIKVCFQFINGLRADSIDKDILDAFKEIGVRTVAYGVESGNEKILKNIKKNIPLEATRRAFKLSKELGFITWAFIIFGLPGETEETIRQSIGFAKELDPDFVKFLILKPYPGSEIYAQFQSENLILSNNYDDYGVYTKPIHRLPELSPEKMQYWQKRAFKEFYLRPRKIISHLKKIKSWTEFKLLVNDFVLGVNIIFKHS